MSNLTNRLNSLWSMLEEEGYYTKANTAMLARNRIEELEAKLEMATGALERIASGEFDGVMLLSLPPQDAARSYAARILAELKGDKKP